MANFGHVLDEFLLVHAEFLLACQNYNKANERLYRTKPTSKNYQAACVQKQDASKYMDKHKAKFLDAKKVLIRMYSNTEQSEELE